MRYLAIYGASDDLIEVEGAIREEFGAYRPTTLRIFAKLPDGAVRRAEVKGKFWDDWQFEYHTTDEWEVVEFGGNALLFVLHPGEYVAVEAEE